jgi:hypothetical protein
MPTTYDGLLLDQGGATHNVKSSAYGAKGDTRIVANASITSGSTSLSVSGSSPFSAGDVGKRIRVAGAGAGGGVLSTTIQSYTSSTQVMLAAVASTTVSGAWIAFGTNDATAINSAITAAANAGGGIVYFPPGTYMLGSTITLKKYVRLIGAGRESTALRLDFDGYLLRYDAASHPSQLQTGVIDIMDLSLVGGDSQQQVSRTYPAIEIRCLTSVNVTRCFFDHFASAPPVMFWYFVENSSITQSFFLNLRGTGLQIAKDSNNNHFIGVTFGAINTSAGNSAIGIQMGEDIPSGYTANQNNVIMGCNFEGHGFGLIGIACPGSINTLIIGNYFEYLTGACVSATAGKATNLTIDNNHLHATSAAACYVNIHSSSGVGPNERVTIVNNRFQYLGDVSTAPLGINAGSTSNLVVLNNLSTDGGPLVSIGGVNQPTRDYFQADLLQRSRLALMPASAIVAAPGLTVTPDSSTTGYLIISVVGGNAFTVANPTGSPASGQQLTLNLVSSGTQMGVITWGNQYILAGGTFPRPAAGKGRIVTFLFDGTSWREASRASADT